jgi:hypothetical protein
MNAKVKKFEKISEGLDSRVNQWCEGASPSLAIRLQHMTSIMSILWIEKIHIKTTLDTSTWKEK